MSTSSTLVSTDSSQQVLCCYRNGRSQVQVAKLFVDSALCLERVIFPNEQFLFEASLDAVLEIVSQDSAGALSKESTPCSNLRVKD